MYETFKEVDLGKFYLKPVVDRDSGDVTIEAKCCGRHLTDVLKASRDELLHHNPDGRRKKRVDFEFRVMDYSDDSDGEASFPEVSPEKWAKMRKEEGWGAYYIEIYDTEDNDFCLLCQLNEWDDDPLVEDMFISLDYWDSFITFVRKYNLITTKQAKLYHL